MVHYGIFHSIFHHQGEPLLRSNLITKTKHTQDADLQTGHDMAGVENSILLETNGGHLGRELFSGDNVFEVVRHLLLPTFCTSHRCVWRQKVNISRRVGQWT